MVYADWLHAEGAPTVLVYAHYDVQPVDPLDLWVRPPFEPRVEDGRVYARGAADDKGQLHLHLWAARAWLETAGSLPVNLRFVFEGEEESGSANFDAWLEANRDRLKADLAVISDTGFFEGNLPAITVGLRGLMYAQIDVTGPTRRPPLRLLRRQRPEPGHRAGEDRRRAQERRRLRRTCPASTTRCAR